MTAGMDHSGLEEELRELGRLLVLPPAPDVSGAVRERLAGQPPRAPRRAPRWAVPVAAAVAALLALLAATPAGQAAVARLWEFAGVVVRSGAPATPAPPGGAGTLPGQSRQDLATARRQAGFPILVPRRLGTPDVVLVADGGRVVSLIYRTGPGRPPAGTGGVSARLDEFDGTLDPVFEKVIAAPDVQVVDVNGSQAVWVPGPHSVTYLGRDGGYHEESAHLAANTLIWQSGRVTLRLEGAFSLPAALAVARSTT